MPLTDRHKPEPLIEKLRNLPPLKDHERALAVKLAAIVGISPLQGIQFARLWLNRTR